MSSSYNVFLYADPGTWLPIPSENVFYFINYIVVHSLDSALMNSCFMALNNPPENVEKEWSKVDHVKIRRALLELENRDSPLPTTSRVNALKLVQIFKIQYNRSADKFVSLMLAQKNRKVRFVLLKVLMVKCACVLIASLS